MTSPVAVSVTSASSTTSPSIVITSAVTGWSIVICWPENSASVTFNSPLTFSVPVPAIIVSVKSPVTSPARRMFAPVAPPSLVVSTTEFAVSSTVPRAISWSAERTVPPRYVFSGLVALPTVARPPVNVRTSSWLSPSDTLPVLSIATAEVICTVPPSSRTSYARPNVMS